MLLGEDDRERKDGGGDAGGHCCWACAVAGEVSASSPATCGRLSVSPSLCRGSVCVAVRRAHAAPDELRRRTLS